MLIFWASDIYPLWAATRLKKQCNAKVIAQYQGQYQFEGESDLKKWKQYGMSSADECVVSQPVCDHMKTQKSWEKYPFKVLNPHLNLEKFSAERYDRDAIRAKLGWQGKQVAICVGQVHEGKGQRWLAECFLNNQSLYSKWHLAIVGPMRADSEEAFNNLKAKDSDNRMHCLGKRSDIPELLVASDLAIFPGTVKESFGLAVAEAALMGLPVLATKAGALASILADYPGAVDVENRAQIFDLWENLEDSHDDSLQAHFKTVLAKEAWSKALKALLA